MKKIKSAGLLFALICSAALGAAERPVKAVLFPYQEATLVSQIDGTVKKYFFRVGERFKSGVCIMQIDDTPYRIELERVTARKEEIDVQLALAKETYISQKKLFEQDFQSKLELQRREAEYQALSARSKIARADCEEAKLRVGYCRKEAPFDGRIEQMLCREHETVRAGQPLFRIIDDRQLLAVMNIPLTDLKPVGAELKFSFGKQIVTGKVYEISPQADHRSGTIEVKALIRNSSGKLTSGMTGELLR